METLWHLRIEETKSIPTALYSYMDTTCAVGSVLGIPTRAPSIEQQFLQYSTVQYSIREAQAACPCTKSPHSRARCTIFSDWGGGLIGPLSRGHSEKRHSQPHPSSTDGSSPLPHDSKEYGKAVAQAAPPHSQTSLRRRTSVAERSACGDRSVMLPKASAIYLATCQDGSSKAPVWCATKITSPCCTGNIRTLPTCAHIQPRASAVLPNTLDLHLEQPVGWRAATPSRR
jgi:hypothetical protein